jgi:alpha-glucosidase
MIPLGYALSELQETRTGFIAHLGLAGLACNAFGLDIPELTIEVSYDTDTRSVTLEVAVLEI